MKYTQRRKKASRPNRQTRIKKGGDPTNYKYRYTKNLPRESWTTAVYPYGLEIVNLVTKIRWSTYEFVGDTYVEYMNEETENEGNIVEMKRVRAVLSDTPYQFFGGGACELYAKAFPEAADIHRTVDPTSDLDIRIEPPILKVIGAKTNFDSYPMKLGDDYTPIAEHYSNWLFDEVVNVFRGANIFNSPKFLPPLRENTSETSESDRNETLGNILVSRIMGSGMIKIQLTTKANGIADHFLEFVLPVNNSVTRYSYIDKPYFIGQVPVVPPLKLFVEQAQGIQNRLTGFPGTLNNLQHERYIHKFYNHCGRMIYLAKLMLYLHDTGKYSFSMERPQAFIALAKYYHTGRLEKICPPFSEISDMVFHILDLIVPGTLRYQDQLEALSAKKGPILHPRNYRHPNFRLGVGIDFTPTKR
jgi:hypothetical protein